MNIIFLDTETTGKPRDYRAAEDDITNWPRCAQLAFQITDEHNNLIWEYKSLIYPDGWTIPREKFFIENDMSTEKCEAAGIRMPTVLDFLIGRIVSNDVQVMVCHNKDFDWPVLLCETKRYGKEFPPIKKMCTMKETISYCKIPFGNDHRPWKNNNWKYPKLEELYRKLFEKDFEGAHDALFDVKACRDCFFELLKRGIISLPQVAV